MGESCFCHSGLERVEIPAGVAEIEKCAFSHCRFLRNVTFMAQSALRVIRTGAFEWTALEELVTPASLREIGAEAFNGCKRLQTVRLNEGLEMLGTDVEMVSDRRRCGVF